MEKRVRKCEYRTGNTSRKTQLEVRLEKKGPVLDCNGREGMLKVVPSKFIIKREELRSVVELNKRYILYFRLTKDSYGKGSVVDLMPVDPTQS